MYFSSIKGSKVYKKKGLQKKKTRCDSIQGYKCKTPPCKGISWAPSVTNPQMCVAGVETKKPTWQMPLDLSRLSTLAKNKRCKRQHGRCMRSSSKPGWWFDDAWCCIHEQLNSLLAYHDYHAMPWSLLAHARLEENAPTPTVPTPGYPGFKPRKVLV